MGSEFGEATTELDTSAHIPNEKVSNPDEKAREEKKYYKYAGLQREGRTKKAYKPQYAPLKWKCHECARASFAAKADVEIHYRSEHNKEFPRMVE